MPQADYVISDEPGATFLTDINAQLAAIVTVNSGATEPATMYARMWWADTTTGLLKQRNAANSAWLIRGTLAETFVLTRSSDTQIGVANFNQTIKATGTFTQTFAGVSTLGDGFVCGYVNAGSGVITLDPNSSETIDGATTIDLQPGDGVLIACNGSALYTIGRRGFSLATDGTLANNSLLAPGTHAATSKTTPADADEIGLVDSAASNVWKKLTWANLKAAVGGATVITPAVSIYTASATVTIPTGATKCKVTLVGGGGGGGGCPGNAAGGGGGGAGALMKYLSGLTPGGTLALTIGAGGAGGGSNANGSDGNDSTLASGTQSITTLTASKGLLGTTSTPGAGGTGTNGDLNITGGRGVNTASSFSKGGDSGFGLGIGGSVFITSSSANGVSGKGYGAGGSGGVNFVDASPTGGDGTGGCAIFEWYN
jgi:hypothetical protein